MPSLLATGPGMHYRSVKTVNQLVKQSKQVSFVFALK